MSRTALQAVVFALILACSDGGSDGGPSEPGPILGTRDNPANIGQAVVVETESIFGNATMTLTVTEVISGQEALDIILAANQFNDVPEPGWEYKMVKVRVMVLESDEVGFDMNHAVWEAVSQDGVVYNNFVAVSGVEPDLRTTIFEGGTHQGFTYFIVREEDHPFALFFDCCWFRLV